MKLAAALTAAATAACLIAAAAPASAEELPPVPSVGEVFRLLDPPAEITQDKCVVTYVNGRWEIVCVPYGDFGREIEVGG